MPLAPNARVFAHLMIEANQFDEAKKVLGYGFNAVRRFRGNKRAITLRDMAEHVDTIARDFKKVEQHTATLRENPDNKEANLAVGRFECFVKGNWTMGLEHLAKSSDATLGKLANDTLADPQDAEAKYRIASGWWKQGQTLQGVSKDRVLGYASGWYDKALPGLTGLSKVTAEKRLAEVKPIADSGGIGGGPVRRGPRTINLLSLIDPEQDFKSGGKWAMNNDILQCTRGGFVPKYVFPYQPPEEYDVTFVYSQPRLRNAVGVLMPNPNGGSSFAFHLGGDSGKALSLSNDAGKYRRKFPQLIQPNVKYAVVIKVRKQNINVAINGTPVIALRTDYSDLKAGSWHRIDRWQNVAIFCDDPTAFYKVELTEVTGEGALTRFPKE